MPSFNVEKCWRWKKVAKVSPSLQHREAGFLGAAAGDTAPVLREGK